MWNISFLSPGFLFGLFACILPLVIHFFIKKKIIILPFSFIHFIESVSQKKLQSFKLSKILLLILRILILTVLAIALAKPFFHTQRDMFSSVGEEKSIVILLDNSYSMSMVDTNISRWERAKDTVKEIVNMMSERDEVSLITFSLKTDQIQNFTKDKNLILHILNKSQVSNLNTDISLGLKTANRLLKKSHNQVKKIILITDMQKSGWYGIDSEIVSPEVKINVVNVGQENTSNLAVVKLDFPFQAVIGQIIPFTAIVKNHGNESIQNKLLSLVVGGQKVNTKQINLEPQEEKKVTLYYTFSALGIHSGYVELNEDFMPIDNKYYFCINAIDKINVLSVNSSKENKDTFYINTALQPTSTHDSLFKITGINEDELDKIEFSNFDIYIFSNLTEITSLQAKVLEECVKRGGGILFFLGDNIQPEKYNRLLYQNNIGMLPCKITYQVSSSSEQNSNDKYFMINQIDTKHPIFSIFQDETLNALKKVPFYTFYRVDVDELSKEIKVLARYNDGLPALIEKKFGQGKILLFTSSIDLNWNTLVVGNIFPTLIHQSINYLSLYKENDKINFRIDDNALPKGVVSSAPGIHKNNENKLYAMNLNFKESNLETIQGKEILKKLKLENIQLSFTTPNKNNSIFDLSRWFKGDVWKLLFILLLILLVLETLVANGSLTRIKMKRN